MSVTSLLYRQADELVEVKVGLRWLHVKDVFGGLKKNGYCRGRMKMKVMQSSDPIKFQNLTQTLEFSYQALASGVAQHAEMRRGEIEKEKAEKSSAITDS
ncbi:hypothetical protein KIW84_013560 [Lathyrus oleraceus]|uniref:Uncharacterized protein n=1 Tax=Pisum sativum TaxID=3888 RepID=A0A9D5BKU4_PEA|nr:hypothetical protein KIW84_013560 [Pisum sativum]